MNYESILSKFQQYFGNIELPSITSEDILDFMSTITDGTKQNTKKLRFTLLSAFFNFVKNSLDPQVQNPCDTLALRKLFRAGKPTQLKILEKDVVDEIIFRTRNQRNRLMLELMARSGMRIGVVLKHASRSGTPLEIVSKVLLRHSNLSTAQWYLGKISDAEAMRWILEKINIWIFNNRIIIVESRLSCTEK